MSAEKLTCRVNRSYDGLFEMHRHELHPTTGGDESWPIDTAVWFGVVDIACDTQEAIGLWGTDILIELEDGRMGSARCLSAYVRQEYAAEREGENTSGSLCMLYVVGLTALAPPVRSEPELWDS